MSETVALVDMPGGPEFVQRCVAAAAELSLFWVGKPDQEMLTSLYQTRQNLQAQLTPEIGAGAARVLAQAFVGTVARRKADIERAAGDHKGQLQ